MSKIEQKLESMGYKIEPVDQMDTGRFVMAQRTGNLVFTAGKISSWNGEEIKGKVGSGLSLEEGKRAALLCTLGTLQVLKTLLGDLDNIVRFVKINGMVNVAEGFNDTSGVINGCSEFVREVFGDEVGAHARIAVGMVLPSDFAVELDMVLEVSPE